MTASERTLIITRRGQTTTLPLAATGTISIGRSASCDCQLDDHRVSRHHAVIHLGPELAIEDLGSHNGTALLVAAPDGGADTATAGTLERKLAPHVRTALPDDAMIQIGAAVITVEGRRPATPAPAVDPAIVVIEPAMHRVYELAARVATSALSVVLLGESGVGKDVLARYIHRVSGRRGPLICINCGAMPEALLESELFGYDKGAFTGADRSKPGLFEAADGGTVFLDEIGEMSLALQVKLLRVLEAGELTRLGAVAPRAVDLRIVAATNRDLEADVAAGRFRQDLYYRLEGIALVVPPLRERRAEIMPLADRFLAELAREQGRAPPTMSRRFRELLATHDWPGNVRQLRNLIQRAAVLCTGPELMVEHLDLSAVIAAQRTAPPGGPAPAPVGPPAPAWPADALPMAPQASPTIPLHVADDGATPEALRDRAEVLERQRVLDALEACAGNQTRAAELLGMTRRALVGRLEKYGVPRPRKP